MSSVKIIIFVSLKQKVDPLVETAFVTILYELFHIYTKW